MSFILSNRPCLSPQTLARYINRPGIRSLAHLWYNKANSFRTAVGPEPGRAYLLMKFADFDALNPNTFHDLVLTRPKAEPITIPNLVIIGGTCVTPGAEDDPSSHYCVELADARWLCWNPYFGATVNKGYNVSAPNASQFYYQDTLNGGNTWSWQALLNDLWNTCNVAELGNAPTLDVQPDGAPENLRFHHVSAWLAYHEICRKLGVALTFNPFSGQHSLFQIGGTDAQFDDAQRKYHGHRLNDLYPKEANRAKIPSKVRVCFHERHKHYGTEKTTGWAAGAQWSVTPIRTVEVNDPTNTPGTYANSVVTLWDELTAEINYDGTVANQAALNARATDRANAYYRMIGAGSGTGKWLWRRYKGFIRDDGFIPGLGLTGLAYMDTGTGWQTEITNLPGPLQSAVTMGTNSGPNAVDFRAAAGGGGERLAERLQTPDFGRAQLLGYPPTDQALRCTSVTSVATNVYPAEVIRINPADRVITALETCWMYMPNGCPPTLNNIYPGRANGNQTFNSSLRPFYVVLGW